MRDVLFEDWGLTDYQEAWDRQKQLFDRLVGFKSSKEKTEESLPAHYFILCQHPHVYTLGKSGHKDNLLVSEQFLEEKGAALYRIERGGDITYHGPGQWVGYPILDLDDFSLSLREYIFLIEEGILRTLADFNVAAGRFQGGVGVWIEAENPLKARKICAIGVRAGRGITMHGFALNVNTDLSFFNYIHPCGFIDKGVTSLAKELGREVCMEEVKERLQVHFFSLLQEAWEKSH